MASPLSWIRKYQKGMLVVFGILLMIVFLVPQIPNIGQQRVTAKNPTVVTWHGGAMKRQDLDMMRIRHYQTMEFLNGVQTYASQKKGQPVLPMIAEIQSIGDVDIDDADEQLLIRYLFAQEAEKAGVEIGEAMINDFIALTAGEVNLTDEELRGICNRYASGVSLGQVRDQLKLELANRQYQLMTMAGMQMVPNTMPNATEGAVLFERGAQTIECVVLPISIQDNLAKVTSTPTEAELRELYTEGRYQLPDPTGRKPGFKSPRAVNVQYVTADFENFLTNEMAKLTDEEVQIEYDRLVAAEDPSVMELADEQPETTTPETPTDGSTPPADGENTKDGGATGIEATNEPEAKSDEAPKDGDKTEESGVSEADDKSGTGEPDGKPETTPPEKEKDPESGGGQTSTAVEINTFAGIFSRNSIAAGILTIATHPQDGDAEKQEGPEKSGAENSGEKQSETAETPKPVVPPQSADEAARAQSQAAIDEAARAAAMAGEAALNGVTEAAQAAEGNLPGTQDATIVQKTVRPLKDVAEQIKRQMKNEAAMLAMERVIEEAQMDMRDYQTDLMIWESEMESERGDKPVAPKLEAFAKRYGLMHGETGLVDLPELQKTEVGKLMIGIETQQRIAIVSQYIFQSFKDLRVYEPQAMPSYSMDRNRWIFWLSEKKEVETADFDSVREKVVEFWKLGQARKMAEAQAENIVADINNGGTLLSVKFGEKAISTGEFAWYSTSFNSFEYGSPVGVDRPGREFMLVAFDLENQKAGYATNMPGDKIYVIQRVSGDMRSEVELVDNYIAQVATAQQLPQAVLAASQQEFREVSEDFTNQLIKRLNIEWQLR